MKSHADDTKGKRLVFRLYRVYKKMARFSNLSRTFTYHRCIPDNTEIKWKTQTLLELLTNTCKILFWSISQEPIGQLKSYCQFYFLRKFAWIAYIIFLLKSIDNIEIAPPKCSILGSVPPKVILPLHFASILISGNCCFQRVPMTKKK